MSLISYLIIIFIQITVFCSIPQPIIKDIFFAKSFDLILNNATLTPTNTSQGILTFDSWQFESTSSPSSNNLALGIQTIDIDSQNQTLSFSIEEIIVYHTYLTLNVWTLAGNSILGQFLSIRCLFIDYQASIPYYSQIPNYFVIQQETFQMIKPAGLIFSNPLITSQYVQFDQYGTTGLSANNFQFSIFITTLVVAQDNLNSFLLNIFSMSASKSNNTHFEFQLSRNFQIDIIELTIKFVIADVKKINAIGNFNLLFQTIKIQGNQINNQSISINQVYQYLSSGKSVNLLLGLSKVQGRYISLQTFWNSTSQASFQIIMRNSSCSSCIFTLNYVRVLKNRCNQIDLLKYPYYYKATNMCFNKCPLFTYLNQSTLECEDCAINNCLQCRNSSFCVRCIYPIYRVNPVNSCQCIRLCKDDACLECSINDEKYCLRCDSSLGKININGLCLPTCGDGIKDILQECDDKNILSFDGCSANCRIQKNFECFQIQHLNTNLFYSHCIYTQQVKMELKIIKKLKFQNKIQIQFKIDHYWSQYQNFIQNKLILAAFQFEFAIKRQTIAFDIIPYQDQSYLGILTIQYLESIENIISKLKFTPPLTNLSIFVFQSPKNSITVPPDIQFQSRTQHYGNFSLKQFSKAARYLYQYTPSSIIQLIMKSSNNNFLYLYSQSQNQLAKNIYILAKTSVIICYLIFFCSYFYGKTISVDLIIVFQLIYVILMTSTQISATYAGLVIQEWQINFFGFSINDNKSVIYQQGNANLRGLNLSINPSINLNIMIIFCIIPFIFSLLIFIVKCFWKTRNNILRKISALSIGQFTFYGLLSISVIGNISTAIIVKALFNNQVIKISSIDVAILSIFNSFQLVYFVFLCKKPSCFGQFTRQMLKFDKSRYLYNGIQVVIVLNTYTSIFSLGSILQKYASLLTCMSFICLFLYFILKQPFIHKKSNRRAGLTYFLGSFLCLGIYLQNQLEHSMLYHYWPLVIISIFLVIQVYSAVFLFIFIKRGKQILHNYLKTYHQYSKADYRQIQNKQFQKKYFPTIQKQKNEQNIKSQMKGVDYQFEWENYDKITKERYNIEQKNKFLLKMQSPNIFQNFNSNNSYNYLQNEHQISQRKAINSNKILENQEQRQAEGYQNIIQKNKVKNHKKQINQALRVFQNSQRTNLFRETS